MWPRSGPLATVVAARDGAAFAAFVREDVARRAEAARVANVEAAQRPAGGIIPMRERVARLEDRPGTPSFGTSGVGDPQDLSARAFNAVLEPVRNPACEAGVGVDPPPATPDAPR